VHVTVLTDVDSRPAGWLQWDVFVVFTSGK